MKNSDYDIVANENFYTPLNLPENETVDYVNLSPKFRSELIQDKELNSADLMGQLINEASQAYASGAIYKALNIYDQLVSIEPTNNVLIANRSAILLKMGRNSEAIEQANFAIQLKPDWPKAYFRKAEALRESESFDEALLAYGQSLQLDIENVQFRSKLIACAFSSSINESFKLSFEQIKRLKFDANVYVLISLIGQLLLNEILAEKNALALELLKITVGMDSPSPQLKLSTLGALAKAYYLVGDIDSSMTYMNSQLSLAEELKDRENCLIIHKNIAKIAIKNDDKEKAIFHMRKQIELLESEKRDSSTIRCDLAEIISKENFQEADFEFGIVLENDPKNVRALLGMGRCFFYKDQFSEAISFFNRVQSFANNPAEIAMAIFFKSKCLLGKGNAEKALQILQEFNISAKKSLIKPKKIVGMLYGILSSCYQTVENLKQAQEYAKKELKLAVELNDKILHAEAFFLMANIYAKNGNWENALKLALKLYELVSLNVDLNDSILNTLELLGTLYIKSENYELALKFTQLRLEYAQKLDVDKLSNLKILFEINSDIANVYAKLNQQENRKRHIDVESSLLAENPERLDLNFELKLNEDLAAYFFDIFEWPTSIFHFEKALMIVQEIDNPLKEMFICEQLGKAHLEMQCEQNYESACVYFHQFLTLSQQLRNIDAILRAYSYLAKIYTKQESWNEALESLKYEITLSKLLKRPEQRLGAIVSLGRIYLQLSNPENSSKLFQKAKNLSEKLQNSENNQTISLEKLKNQNVQLNSNNNML